MSHKRTVFTGWMALIVIVIMMIAQLLAAPLARTSAASDDLSVYGDALSAGWEDWSWETTTAFANAAPTHSGAASIAVTHDAAFAGFSLRSTDAIATAGYTAIRFWAHGGAAARNLHVTTQASDEGEVGMAKAITVQPGMWQQITVPLSDLGSPAAIKRINWQEAGGAAQTVYYMDDIVLAGADDTTTFPDPVADAQRGFDPGPSGVALAPNGRVYVAVYQANRVYSWASLAAMTTNQAPDLTFGGENGNPDNGCTNGPSATVLCGPESVAVDANGNLYVGDTYNHRIVIFYDPDADASPTEADNWLGQPDLNSGAFNYDSAGADGVVEGFCFSRGVAVDAAGNVYAVDEWNHRVLIFDDPLNSDRLPDRVLGQAALDDGINAQCTVAFPDGSNAADRLFTPLGVAVDAAGNVFVADTFNSRVQRFNAGFASGAAASETYGGFDFPHDVAVDGDGNLYVADTRNNRVRVFAGGDTIHDHEYTGLHYPMGMAHTVNGDFVVANCGANSAGDPHGFPPCLLDPRDVRVFNAPDVVPPPPGGNITLSVDVDAARKPISPYVYGLNFAKEAFANEIDLPLRRWGGNATTRYNWQTGNTNHAADWFFHNNNAYDPYTGNAQNADQWVQENGRTGAASLVTLPMIGYVAKDGNQATCGYKVSKYGPQDDVDNESGFPDCGNGLNNGAPIIADATDTSIAVDQNFVAGWVTHLKENAAANGPVAFYALDNEPDIWFETHRDVAPVGWKYDEFRDLSVLYGAAAKAADPAAQLLGPVVNGWTYYWHGAYDGQREDWATPDDRNAHGGTPFVEWYLQQMRAYEENSGTRLLDYLDLHFYPQNGVDQTLAGDANKQALRLRSTRALWDPTYVDESWIADAGPDGGIVKLIPRMRAWVDAHYPGTKLAITEYNWGGLEHINGAVAQADILGVFGREGLDMAALWNYPVRKNNAGEEIKYDIFETLPGAYAFRMYRNYDGQGGQFGDIRVQAVSSDQGKLSVYAAQRSNDGSLTLMIVNKTSGALTATLAISNYLSSDLAEVYRYSAADLDAIQRLADQNIDNESFTADFPANSITLVRIPAADGPTPIPTPTPTPPVGGQPERTYLPHVVR